MSRMSRSIFFRNEINLSEATLCDHEPRWDYKSMPSNCLRPMPNTFKDFFMA